MTSLKISVLANFLGTLVNSVLSLALVPIYIHFLGVESFGLIGFFLSMRALFSLLNFGLSPATNREIARRSHAPEKAWESMNLLRTLEVIFYAIGFAIAAAMAILSGWIAENWVDAQFLSPDTMRLAIAVFGATLMIRWPIELYYGVLRGLEKQPLLNGITSLVSLVTGLGTVAVLVWVSRTLNGFLIWQGVCGAFELAVMAFIAWRLLKGKGDHQPVFEFRILKEIWRFSASMTGITFFAVAFKQADKLIISKVLPLEFLGYYTVATNASNGLGHLINPITKAVFPRFSSLIARNEKAELARLFRSTCQAVAFFLAPAAAILILFPRDILFQWTRSETLAEQAHVALSVLGFSSLVSCLLGPINSLNIAHGRTSIPFWTNFVGLFAFAPLSFWLVGRHGITGGGISWAIWSLTNLLVMPPLVLRGVLPRQVGSWYLRDTLPFLLLAAGLFGGAAAATHATALWGRLGAVVLASALYLCLGLLWCAPARDQVSRVASKLQKIRAG